MHILEQRLAKFHEIVSQDFCEALAKKCGLVKRSSSRLKGHEFAQAMMVPNAFIGRETLNSLAVRIQRINNNCEISASALAQRINTKAAEDFMRACFAAVLSRVIKKNSVRLSDLPQLSRFNRVLIEDSTMAELHEKLSPHFRGSGGSASKSSVKINFTFDYLSEEIVGLNFYSGHISDQRLAKGIMEILRENDLVIRDLGYYSLANFKELERLLAFYISRLKQCAIMYENKDANHPIDLAKLLDLKTRDGGIVDIEIFLGEERHPVRLVACRLSEEALNKRMRTVNRSAQRHKVGISAKKKSLLKYSMFITNVPKEKLSALAVMALYRARWRVELVFKQWKSCLNLHVFKGYNKERIHCFLYGRMIMVLLLGALSPPLMDYALSLGRELSCYKLANYMIADHIFARAIQDNNLSKFIEALLRDVPRRLSKDIRKRPSLRSNVRMANSDFSTEEYAEVLTNVA